jgi:hypothetical protein
MSNTIVLNSTNVVSGSNNSALRYNFPNSVVFDDHQIAVQSVSMYYSWQNINNTTLKNNTFSYTWTIAGTTTTYNVTIPSGLYEITDINNFLQYTFIMNGHYLINSTSQNVYYAEFLVNPNTYSINIITYPVPTSLPSGWSIPVANVQTGALAWGGFPTTFFNPLITIPSNLNLILGYVAGFTTSQNTGINTILTYTSSVAPQVAPNPNALITISNISNIYSSPSSVIYNVYANVGFGALITQEPSEYAWVDLLKGATSNLTLRFVGNDGSALSILDPNITILLLIRKKPISERG